PAAPRCRSRAQLYRPGDRVARPGSAGEGRTGPDGAARTERTGRGAHVGARHDQRTDRGAAGLPGQTNGQPDEWANLRGVGLERVEQRGKNCAHARRDHRPRGTTDHVAARRIGAGDGRARSLGRLAEGAVTAALGFVNWALIALSLTIPVLELWLGLIVLLNAENRTWGMWLSSGGLLTGGIFFISHTAILGRGLTTFDPSMNFWWY